jgi:hypothetical protein
MPFPSNVRGFIAFSLAAICVCAPARQAGQGHPSGQPDKAIVSAHSSILIDITGKSPDGDRIWKYRLELPSGTVRMVREEALKTDKGHRLSDPSIKPAGSVQGCTGKPKAYSPDGVHFAACTISGKTDHSPGGDLLSIAGTKTKSPLHQWALKGRSIRGFAWSPDSRLLAILNETESDNHSPAGILFGLAGHPIPQNQVFLDLIDAQTGSVSEYSLRKDIPYAYPWIVGWTN